ncbi:superoxide dismutase [Streptomyces sp. SID8350]|nr:superoxide dismutase [Streptomyces sp. SID8350]
MSRRRILAALAGAATLAATSGVTRPTVAAASASADRARSQPMTLSLPTGFQPESIAISGRYGHVTSLTNGDVYKINLITGAGRTLASGPGTSSCGIKIDAHGRLFVVGTGILTVISASTGVILARYQIAAPGGFLNDVLLTPEAAYVTDSALPVLYRLPFGRGGTLPARSDVVRVPLGGDIVYQEGWNVSGIVRTPDRTALLVAQSNTGRLHRVDPASGAGTHVDLGSVTLIGGDGLLMLGRTLYVVQGGSNMVSVVRLNTNGTSGSLIDQRTDPRFDVPTGVARFSNRLYLTNARTEVPSPQTEQFTVVALPI